MKRDEGDVSFNRDWEAYKLGFGNLAGDHWLGLHYMHLLTENRRYTLRYVHSKSSDGQRVASCSSDRRTMSSMHLLYKK